MGRIRVDGCLTVRWQRASGGGVAREAHGNSRRAQPAMAADVGRLVKPRKKKTNGNKIVLLDQR